MRQQNWLQMLFSNTSSAIEACHEADIQAREQEAEATYNELKQLLQAKKALASLRDFYQQIIIASVALQHPQLFASFVGVSEKRYMKNPEKYNIKVAACFFSRNEKEIKLAFAKFSSVVKAGCSACH